MPASRRAVIDIGTNSVKLLVADVSAAAVHPVLEDSRQTRLGQGFYDTHRLRPDAIRQTATAVKQFCAVARDRQASGIRVIATSAARDAVNPHDLTDAVERATGLRVEIISGEQEAEWAYQGAISNASLARQPLLLLDAGGGSTEFILGHGEHKVFRRSFRLGTVRLLEQFPVSDPPTPGERAACRAWLDQFLQTEVRPGLAAGLAGLGQVQLVGSGGTATILARIEAGMDDWDRDRIEALRLEADRVRAVGGRLWGLSLADRRKITGLPPTRADVILGGVMIYEAVMAELGFREMRVSTRGLRFAAVQDAPPA